MGRLKEGKRRMKKLLMLILCGIFTNQGMADKSPLPIPQDFMFEGKPIAPACIDHFFGVGTDDAISLQNDPCQKVKEAYNPEKIKEGLLGYSSPDGSSRYYKYLGEIHFQGLKTPGYYLLYMEWSGGGTGYFTSISIVEHSHNTLRLVDTLASGDRCIGGVSQAAYKDGILTYKQHMTPQGLIRKLQKDFETKFDFDDSAASCMGELTYRGSDITDFTFNQDVLSSFEDTKSDSPQACYNQIIKETIKGGKHTLTPDELKSFVQKIKEKCTRKKTSFSL